MIHKTASVEILFRTCSECIHILTIFEENIQVMNLYSIIASAASVMMLVSCGGSAYQSAAGVEVPGEVKAGDVQFVMETVPGGSFSMGRTPAGTRIAGATLHHVVLNGFSISKLPVTQELWKAVTGSEAGSVQNPAAPVDMVSYDDCVKFLGKLSKMTGIPFSLPTEAQWEYAAAEGLVTVNPNYSEWCADSFSDTQSDTLVQNPLCTDNTDNKVSRTRKSREAESSYVRKPGLGFRVAVNTETPVPEDVIAAILNREPERGSVSSDEIVNVGKYNVRMIGVEGGIFSMGATPEQGTMAGSDESPVHEVTLDGFELGQTEVTAGLWLEVMGSLPYKNSDKELDKPVVNVSWYDCQNFIIKLNRMTGRKFRLPTEAEWEFAARGGVKSSGNQFAGGMYVSQVAAYLNNASSEVMPVKSFRPNELGLYDMSGNAWEWCQDSFYDYPGEPETNPCHILPGELRIMRGGSAASKWDACRVANRSKLPASSVKSTFGFRLAL